jgi:hypothetical protein
MATALTTSVASCAWADRLPKALETRPPRIDTTREKNMEGTKGLIAALSFPKGEPRLQKPFDVIVCLKATQKSEMEPSFVSSLVEKIDMKVVMPEHAHGMLVAPERQNPRGTCLVYKGLRFHMAGWWRFEFRSAVNNAEVKVTFDADVPAP